MILQLALAQFIASYEATNMNVAISAIAQDLGTTAAGVQTEITLFALMMAALMIPGSKLTDIWGRKRCWIPGLLLFGARAGVVLTSSVNVVQSSFPDADQREISDLSRSVSNLGASLGTALVGSVLVAVTLPKGQPFAVALTILLVLTIIGLVLAVLIPRQPVQAGEPAGVRTPSAG